ncbi:MAG: Hepatitis C virus core protein [Cyanobacteria bacterium]|nr:Hepatitis C virus core protein [Cyanobacteriota bacterium]
MSPISVPSLGSLSTPAQLIPPRGYRPLAWLGLVANGLTIPLGLALILLDPTWRITHIAVGAGAVLPCAALGIVASVALLQWRHWGQVVAIVALAISLAISLAYGIVRLVLIPADRPLVAVLAVLLWAGNVAVLVYWCRPSVRHYLR